MKLRLILLFALAAGAGRAAEPKATPPAAVPAAPTPTAPSAAPGRRAAPAAATTAAPAANSFVAPTAAYSDFRIITDRNIFNPNRRGLRQNMTQEAPPPRSDTITLVGTMDSDKGLRAFFEVSISRVKPSQAVHVGESIDVFKVTKISPKVIELQRDAKTFSVRVGQQFRRPPGGDWDLVGEDIVLREAQESARGEAKIDPSAPVPIPAGISDVERKMREARNKTLTK